MADDRGIEHLNDTVREMHNFLTNSFNAFLEQDENQSDIMNDMRDSLKAIAKSLDSKDSDKNQSKKAASSDILKSTKDDKTIDYAQLAALGKSMPDLAKGLMLFNFTKTTKFTNFIKDLYNGMTNDGKIKDSKQVTEMYKAIADVLKSLGDNIGKIGKGMVSFNIAAVMGGPKLFIKFMDDFFSKDRLKLLDSKKSKDIGLALHSLGTGILKFSVAMALSTPLLIIGIPGALLLVPMLMLMEVLSKSLGKKSKDIKNGAESMAMMSLGLVAFSASIFIAGLLQPNDLLMGAGVILLFGVFIGVVMLMNKIGGKSATKDGGEAMLLMSTSLIVMSLALVFTRFVQFEDILKGALIMGTTALVAILVGEAKETVKDGAMAMLLVSASLIIATLGILMTRLVTWEDIGKAGAIIGGLALSTILVGKAGTDVKEGAMAMILISGALIVAVLGIWSTELVTWEDIGKAGAIIGGLSVAAIALGQFAPTAIMGAVSLIIISASLIVAAVGIKMIQGIPWEDIGKAGAIIGGLTVAAIALGVAGPVAILGAVSMLLIGASLIVIGKGLESILQVKFTSKDTTRITDMLGSLALTFGEIGLGSLFLIPGTVAAIGMGVALNEIGSGLLKFSQMNISMDKLGGDNGLISQVLYAVIKPFESIGKTYSGGFLGFGGSTDAEKGITAVKGIGDVLCEIAMGVQAFADLKYTDTKGNKIQIPLSDLQAGGKIITSITSVLGAVGAVFADLGAKNGETGWFSKGLIEKGVKSIAGAGENLVNIAKAVQEFANLTYTDKDGKKVPLTNTMLGANGTVSMSIKNTILAMTSALSEIGKNPDAESSFWGGTGAIKLGKAAIDGVGKSIGDIAIAAQGIMNIFVKGVKPEDLNKSVRMTIKAMTGALLDPQLVNNDKTLEKSGELVTTLSKTMKNLANSANDIYGNLSKNKNFDTRFPKMMESMITGFKKINLLAGTKINASEFNKITSGIVNVANSHAQLDKASISIEKISNSLVKAFRSINELADDKLTKVKEFFDTIVEIDKFNQDQFDAKMQQHLDSLTNIPSYTAQPLGPVTATQKPDETSNILIQELKSSFDDMNNTLQAILAKLSGTLSVEMDDDGSSGLTKYSKKA